MKKRSINAFKFLRTYFPNIFENAKRTSIKPLAVGIKEDMISHLMSEFGFTLDEAKEKVQRSLTLVCHTNFYLDKIELGGNRYDIHGNVAGTITEQQIANVKNLKEKRLKYALQNKAKLAISRLGSKPINTVKAKSKKQKKAEAEAKPFTPFLSMLDTELINIDQVPEELKPVIQVVEERLSKGDLLDIKQARIKEAANRLIGLLK